MPASSNQNTWSLITRMRLGLTLLFIPMLLLSGIYYLHMSRVLHQEQEYNLTARNTQFVDSLLAPYLNNLELQFARIYQHVNYQDFSHLPLKNQARYLQQWQAYIDAMELDYIYVGTEQHNVLTQPAKQYDDEYDPGSRPWYQAATRNPGKIIWTDPYYDYALGTLTITIAKAILDPQGKQVGVLAFDTRLPPLSRWLNYANQQNPATSQSRQILISRDALQIAHPESQKLFKPLAYPDWLARMTAPQGFFIDHARGEMVAYHQIPQQHWILISTTPTAGFNQVIDSVSRNVLTMIGCTIVFYLVLAFSWSHYLVGMIKEIRKLIRASIKGEHQSGERRMSELSGIYAEVENASREVADVRRQAHQDKLTGLYNRRFFDERLQHQLDNHVLFGLVMFDLDNFKRVNDTYGHPAGDVVLERVSTLGMKLFDEWGWFCRYGGEELALIFRLDTSPDLFSSLLEAFRVGVEQQEWREPGLVATISGGVAFCSGELTAKALIARADNELYRAKREGKNRICFPSQPSVAPLPPQDIALANNSTSSASHS
ncbi:MAG: sensor domain-containing diguanylate cyclase [Aeromonas sp.]